MIARTLQLFGKMQGDRAVRPPRANVGSIVKGALGAGLGVAAIAFAADTFQAALVLGSFGASCLLMFAYPDLPFSQPRNVISGHVLSSFSGLLLLTLCGPHAWAMALALATAVALMMALHVVHPPAAANPLIVFATRPDWLFLFFPTAFGALLLVAAALIYNNLVREARYPKYW